MVMAVKGKMRFEEKKLIVPAVLRPELPLWAARSGRSSAFRIRVPIGFVADRADYIAEYFAGPSAPAKTARCALRGGWEDFSDGLPETCNRNGLASLENLIEHRQACGFEFGDSYVVHEIHLKVD
jgi:hypothetical protein